jgi:hypothetical protein
MFLINLDAVQPGSDYFDSILAHEFQHMIHWHEDPNEDTWLNEGLSELARYINGFGLSSFADVYLAQPDLQLTAWGADAASRNAHYGSGFLFSTYLFDQYGSEVIRAIMAQPENGVAGIEKALAAQGTDTTFDNIFADFIIANYLNDPQLAEGQWGYHQPDFTLALPEFAAHHTQFPVEVTDTVHQYGVDYIYLDAIPADLTLSFQGNPTVSLLDTQPYSGQHFWYSNRGDSIDTTLTRTFDLRELTTATLQFWAWYEIEASWDYAYVAVSVDGGQTWRTLPATTTTDANPVGMGYGPGFSGQSHGWLEQTVDLTPFAGQLIELRFEYITDDAVNAPGLAIDNIRLPELNYHEDGETPDSGWQAEGFIRTDNVVSQRFIIQLIQLNQAGQVRVSRLPLDALNQGKIKLTGQEDSSVSIILVISAQAPVTTSLAQYSYTLTK